ncbi:MAG: hypothetical protein A2096_07465 [Spirochaetes bacterium GWF1_41_5]|nr:MAG: hypothetical protein A2096_07465 [Spirochaetes bacterium GWF1_41_5]HBE02388.1 hypothetical protein [Spirochaetia bacterium]
MSIFIIFLLRLYSILVFINIIFSFLKPDADFPPVKLIYTLTEPLLEGTRRRVPFALLGPLDLSGVLIIILINIIIKIIQRLAQ